LIVDGNPIELTTLKLVIGSSLIGTRLLIWLDSIVHLALPNTKIPIHIINSTLGSLIFLFIASDTRTTN
jgi:iron complex transport system permease protein